MRFLAGLLIGAAVVFAAAFVIQSGEGSTASPAQAYGTQQASLPAREPTAEPRLEAPVDVTANDKTAAIAPIDHTPIPAAATDPLPDLSNIPPPATQTTVAAQLASVWAPFHSEASARGFARRLTDEIDEPFTVHRAGPANYLVVFPFNNEQDRARISDQIAKVTGMPQP